MILLILLHFSNLQYFADAFHQSDRFKPKNAKDKVLHEKAIKSSITARVSRLNGGVSSSEDLDSWQGFDQVDWNRRLIQLGKVSKVNLESSDTDKILDLEMSLNSENESNQTLEESSSAGEQESSLSILNGIVEHNTK